MVDIYIHRIPPSLSDTFSQNSSPGSFLLGKTQMWYVFTETGISACIYQISRIKLGSFLSYAGKKDGAQGNHKFLLDENVNNVNIIT